MRFTGLRGGVDVAYDEGEQRFVSSAALVAKRLNVALGEKQYRKLSPLEIVRAEFGPQVHEAKVEVPANEPVPEPVQADEPQITYEQ
jgi:hypothetical protein